MANKHGELGLCLVVTRKMQIKSWPSASHLLGMAIMKRESQQQVWVRMWR